MPHVTRLRVVGAAVAAGAMTLGSLAATTAAQAANPRRAIAHTHPAWAVPGKRLGHQAVTSGAVHAQVYLAPNNAAQLASDVAAVSDPKSASYRHFWSAARVRATFTPSAAEVSAVRSWLTSSGLTVTKVSASNPAGAYVAVSGSVAAAGKAFGVSFANYRAPGGQVARAPQSAATAPASVAGYVLAVNGLDTAKSQIKPSLPPPGPNYWVAGPCSKYYTQKIATGVPPAAGKHWPWNVCGYTPNQMRGAYGVNASGKTGKGQTIAIVDAYNSPTMLKDANKYAKVTGDKPFGRGQYKSFSFTPFTLTAANLCDAPGWYGEQTLDVESAHGMAPGANVRYVGAESCNDGDLLTAEAFIVNQDLASIVSNSWGEPASYELLGYAFDDTFALGALEGIGFFFSSGDSGYEGTGEDGASPGDQVDYPTSSPYVTSVGGTSLAIGRSNSYRFETSWGTLIDPLVPAAKHKPAHWTFPPTAAGFKANYPGDYDGSGGGGVSTVYPQPDYQQPVVPASLAESKPGGGTQSQAMRVIPDVAALADPSTGFMVGQTTLQPDGKTYAFALSRIGGTSLACPTFAGIQADAQQAAGGRLGFADPAIYARYGTGAFRDVTDHPGGASQLFQVRNNYTNPYTKQGPLLTYLRILGVNGLGADALPAVKGYDDATGVGSPYRYIQSY